VQLKTFIHLTNGVVSDIIFCPRVAVVVVINDVTFEKKKIATTTTSDGGRERASIHHSCCCVSLFALDDGGKGMAAVRRRRRRSRLLLAPAAVVAAIVVRTVLPFAATAASTILPQPPLAFAVSAAAAVVRFAAAPASATFRLRAVAASSCGGNHPASSSSFAAAFICSTRDNNKKKSASFVVVAPPSASDDGDRSRGKNLSSMPRATTKNNKSKRTIASSAASSSAKEGDGCDGDEGGEEGVMMVLSPAKTLDFSSSPEEASTLPATTTWPQCDAAKTKRIASAMKSRAAGNSTSELAKLLKVSSNIARTAADYWNDFVVDEEGDDVGGEGENAKAKKKNSKPCILAFRGAAYQGLRAYDDQLDGPSLRYLQRNLRIVDPCYGFLKPFDRIQPYRLEMNTKNVFVADGNNPDKAIKLCEYWKPAVTQSLKEEIESRRWQSDSKPSSPPVLLLNLASDEYAAAIDSGALLSNDKVVDVHYVKVVFLEENGRVVAVHAKRARGLMARFVAETRAQTLEDVERFDSEGYRFVRAAFDDDDGGDDEKEEARRRPVELVFKRRAGWKEQKEKTKDIGSSRSSSNTGDGKSAKRTKR